MTDPDRRSAIIEAVALVSSNDVATAASVDRFDELATWDSLCALNLLLALEETFGATLQPEDLEALVSVDSVERLLDERQRG